MKTNNRTVYRWIAIGIALASLLAAIVLYIIQRQWNLYLQITVGVFIIGLAVAVVLDPDSFRQLVTGRQARYGSNALIITGAFLGILIVVNYLGYKNTKQWDLTADKSNTLAKETIDVLKSLPGTVDAKAFFTSNSSIASSKDDAKVLLDKYMYAGNGKFKYEFIDPNKDPASAQDARITKDGTIVLYMGTSKQSVSSVTETELTGAMVRLMNPGTHVIYFLTGHGEYPTSGNNDQSYTLLSSALESKNYNVSSLNLLATGKIPDDASVVVVDGPKKPLSDTEVGLLDGYLKNGGSVVVMEDPILDTQFGDAPDPLATDLAKTYGIVLGNNVVVDQYGYSAFQNPYFALGYQYGNHAITQQLTLSTGFQDARSVSADSTVGTDYTKTQLILTVNQSWGETDMASIQNNSVKQDQGTDLMGPVSLAVAAEDSSTSARLVVFGNSQFATNAYYEFYGNSDMIVNSIDWAAKVENLISLTPKNTVNRTLVQPQQYTMNLIQLGSLVLIPGIILVAGVASYIARKRQG
jgi:ABC-type uncharacterized transport system involved in gliding motility auxiliary subunit